MSAFDPKHRPRQSRVTRHYGRFTLPDYSGLMPANLITLPTCRSRKLLLRRDRHLGDILRNPGFAALHVGTIERLELAFREGMRRRLFDQCLGPALEPWISVDDTERLNAIEEEIALQDRRIGNAGHRA